ncbi:hypothetical protein [Actinophytocola xanthii]|uniref:hypothetical protein n=1 Tax=Actinophytocola xanthii TaxID=1912961 RepID=UPI0009FB5331|nr:hypothetical protein [Actinophytocola xanthii]
MHEVLPAALADCAVPVPHPVVATAQVAFDRLARMQTAHQAGERWVLDKVREIVSDADSDHARGVIDLPLGRIAHLADEWGADWSRPRHELEQEIRDACRAQLAAGRRT